jgi:hypothetical protein
MRVYAVCVMERGREGQLIPCVTGIHIDARDALDDAAGWLYEDLVVMAWENNECMEAVEFRRGKVHRWTLGEY